MRHGVQPGEALTPSAAEHTDPAKGKAPFRPAACPAATQGLWPTECYERTEESKRRGCRDQMLSPALPIPYWVALGLLPYLSWLFFFFLLVKMRLVVQTSSPGPLVSRAAALVEYSHLGCHVCIPGSYGSSLLLACPPWSYFLCIQENHKHLLPSVSSLRRLCSFWECWPILFCQYEDRGCVYQLSCCNILWDAWRKTCISHAFVLCQTQRQRGKSKFQEERVHRELKLSLPAIGGLHLNLVMTQRKK